MFLRSRIMDAKLRREEEYNLLDSSSSWVTGRSSERSRDPKVTFKNGGGGTIQLPRPNVLAFW